MHPCHLLEKEDVVMGFTMESGLEKIILCIKDVDYALHTVAGQNELEQPLWKTPTHTHIASHIFVLCVISLQN